MLNKKSQLLLSFSLLFIGLSLGYFAAQNRLASQHEAELTLLRALDPTKEQELKATKLALEVSKSKVGVWRGLLDEAVQQEAAVVLP